MFSDKQIVVTGGTGSLGQALIRRLLTGEMGAPRKIIVFSRDEEKQHSMRAAQAIVTDDAIYKQSKNVLEFRVGDVRDYHAVCSVLRDADIVFNCAALKQVPMCEYYPFEAVQTNIHGPENIVRAIVEHDLPAKLVVGISTDKACKPINVMGMTKAIQERIFTRANLDCKNTKFVCVRYGNVVGSRGSVIPLFLDQIGRGGPVTITSTEMTRFLLTLDRAVDTIFAAAKQAIPGEIFVPKIKSALVSDIAEVLIDGRDIAIAQTGIRPGEKLHEILVSEEEAARTMDSPFYLVIGPPVPELKSHGCSIGGEFSSADCVMPKDEVRDLLYACGIYK